MSEAVPATADGLSRPRVAENEEGGGDILHTGDLIYLERSPGESKTLNELKSGDGFFARSFGLSLLFN